VRKSGTDSSVPYETLKLSEYQEVKMKRITMLLVLIVAFSALLSQISPIVFIGGSNNWVNGEELIIDGDSVYGWNIGAAVDIWTLQLPIISEFGMRYCSRGFKYEDSGRVDQTDANNIFIGWLSYDCVSETSLNYLDIFAKAKYDILLPADMSLLPYVGYAMSFLLSAKEKNHGEIANFTSYSYTKDTTDDYQSLDHLLLFGLDVSINEMILVGVEYDMGLTYIFKDDNANRKAASFMLNVGYQF